MIVGVTPSKRISRSEVRMLRTNGGEPFPTMRFSLGCIRFFASMESQLHGLVVDLFLFQKCHFGFDFVSLVNFEDLLTKEKRLQNGPNSTRD